MVELALTLPLLLVLAVSCFDYGYFLEHLDNIATVVRDGARYASLYTTASPWSSACPNPTSSGNGGWTCAGLATTVLSQSNGQSITATNYPIYVASIAGFPASASTGFTVSTTNSAGQPAVINCTSTSSTGPTFTGCNATSGSGSLATGAALVGSSDFTEGVIQEEAESLTVPEGGLPIDNIDCCWKGSTGGSGCPSGPGWTSGTTPLWGATVEIPTAWPTGVTAPGVPVSCMTISYWDNSSDTEYTPPLSLCMWWSADATSDAGAPEYVGSNGQCGVNGVLIGDLVQVTVAYAWSQSAPGPAFDVLASTFGIQINASASYSLVVMT